MAGLNPVIDVLIIGAGFGGIAMARELDRLGIVDYLIVEKADRVGGTWRDNTYPGAACDVPVSYTHLTLPTSDLV